MEKKMVLIIVILLAIPIAGFSIFFISGNSVLGGPERSCLDNDGGINFDEQGTIRNENGATYTDRCISSFKLKEYYCGDSGVSDEKILVKITGCNCVEGACVD